MIYLTSTESELNTVNILANNVFEDGTIAFSTQSADGLAANAVEDQTNDYWKPTAMPANLSVNLAVAQQVNMAGFANHTFGTSGTTVKGQYLLGAVWTDLFTVSPTTNKPFVVIFNTIGDTDFRFLLSGVTIPSVAVMKLGKRIPVPGGVDLPYTPLNYLDDNELLSNMSRSGQFLPTRVERYGGETNINLVFQSPSFISGLFNAFRLSFNKGRTFFFTSSPSVFSSDVGYCRRSGKTIQPVYNNVSWLSVELQVRVYVGP